MASYMVDMRSYSMGMQEELAAVNGALAQSIEATAIRQRKAGSTPKIGGRPVLLFWGWRSSALCDDPESVVGVYTKDWGKACFVVLGMEVIRTVR